MRKVFPKKVFLSNNLNHNYGVTLTLKKSQNPTKAKIFNKCSPYYKNLSKFFQLN